MRIITGSLRGRRLKTLDGDSTRPTAEKVKEALFSAIQFDIEGRTVLDLFAGSGQLGLEALSRGAERAFFVDSGRDAAKIIEENIAALGMEEKSSLSRMDYSAFILSNSEIFDIVFIDPPYKSGFVWDALQKISGAVSKGGTVICEHSAGDAAPESVSDFCAVKTRKYGKTAVTIYRRKAAEV